MKIPDYFLVDVLAGSRFQTVLVDIFVIMVDTQAAVGVAVGRDEIVAAGDFLQPEEAGGVSFDTFNSAVMIKFIGRSGES